MSDQLLSSDIDIKWLAKVLMSSLPAGCSRVPTVINTAFTVAGPRPDTGTSNCEGPVDDRWYQQTTRAIQQCSFLHKSIG